jgi:hypothetical protein
MFGCFFFWWGAPLYAVVQRMSDTREATVVTTSPKKSNLIL